MCLNCHVVTVDVEIKDLECLKAACKQLGWQFRENEPLYVWYGQWVDDSPVPRHLFETGEEYQRVLAMTRNDRQKYMAPFLNDTQHSIKVPGYTYELGVKRVGKTWQLIGDWVGDIAAIIRPGATNPICQAYAAAVQEKTARKHGYRINRTTNADGSLTLKMTKGF